MQVSPNSFVPAFPWSVRFRLHRARILPIPCLGSLLLMLRQKNSDDVDDDDNHDDVEVHATTLPSAWPWSNSKRAADI